MRIDKVVVPAGLIRSAKTYSLILEDEGLYVIHTGPATREVRTKNAIEDAAISALHKHYDKKIAQGEARLATTPLSTLAQEKNCAFYKPGEIISVEKGKNWMYDPMLFIRTKKKTHKFNVKNITNEQADAFINELKKRGLPIKV